MNMEMLKLWAVSQGLPSEIVDLVIKRLSESTETIFDFFESGADANRAIEACNLLTAAETAIRLNQPAMAASLVEHAEWLVHGEKAENAEKPGLSVVPMDPEGMPTA